MFIDDLLRSGITEDVGRLCLLIACAGVIYTMAAARCVKQFFRRASIAPSEFPAASILKPLHGDEEGLRDNMEALCRLDYPGQLEIIFGVQDPYDAAIDQVRKLQADYPQIDISLIVDKQEHGANRKISNVINITRSARHDILVLSDSDIGINPDYLHRIVAELDKPGVGLVTCLYRGQSQTGFWSRLASMAIDYSFLPSVIFGMKIGLAKPCFGSTMALRKATLEKIGGFEAFADHLADDNAIGEAVRATLQNVNKLVTDNQVALHDSMENLKTFSKALADNSNRIDSIMVGVESLMGGKEGEEGELQKAARSFRELADNLDKRTAVLTSDGRALITDSRRTLGDISRAVNNFDRNPTRVLFGASNTDNRAAPPQQAPAPPARGHRPAR